MKEDIGRLQRKLGPSDRAKLDAHLQMITEAQNGLKVMVPQFIETGEVIRIDVHKKAYLERVRKK